jgi:uncharacterized Ntn-hydrolase superfamily protein
MAEGYVPAKVMAMFAANDSEHDYRQIAIMDREGRIAAHTGRGCRGWAGTRKAPTASPSATASSARRCSTA